MRKKKGFNTKTGELETGKISIQFPCYVLNQWQYTRQSYSERQAGGSVRNLWHEL